MARITDINPTSTTVQSLPLPVIDWVSIQQSPPTPVPLGTRQPGDPLPAADIVILTWTSAEWSALDHVFLNSSTVRQSQDYQWKSAWLPYTRGAGDYVPDPQSGALWGLFQLVRITDRSGRPWRVLLFKSNSHLAHAPWIKGLGEMVRCILEDAKPDRIYSIGTAGGARIGQRLGDSIVTNSALLDLQRPENASDADNGSLFRCPTWFPVSSLVEDVERSLLYRMNQTVTDDALKELFTQLQGKHVGDGAMAELTLTDLVNDPIRPSDLGAPRILAMKDVPLLTTDFYYIASNGGADAHSFLEMDDAVIAREAELKGVRYAFIRNISDPTVSSRTPSGKLISDGIRSDWSGLIYNRYGLLTSFNSALATWATIAGEGEASYAPPRATQAPYADDPLEVKLAYQVRSCGTCSFFWPEEKRAQSYGLYTAYDFEGDAPYAAPFKSSSNSSPWVLGRTRPPAFPEAEVIDGCRKAPIMTIGINPNLTAFAPGQTGAAWCYPSFSSDNDTDAWAKYAWYYRYRSVYQERLDLAFVRRFILPEGRILATGPGRLTAALRPDDKPAWTIQVRYDGDASDTVIPLPGVQGDFPYVTLFDTVGPNNVFKAGDVIAGRLAVPSGIRVEIQQQQQGYYMQFVPVLEQFQSSLQAAGHTDANLRVGEDVCQLDMVACASPHWNPGFLGGTPEDIKQIVDNCVSKNAWAMKQLIQTRPAVLYIVSESSWIMFRDAFGAFIKRDPPLTTTPVDNDFTLLRETTDPDHPLNFVVRVNLDGREYDCTTRIVITPHFSYNENFQRQFRLSPADWLTFTQQQPACVAAMTLANGFEVVPGNPAYANDYIAVRLSADATQSAASLVLVEKQFPAAYEFLRPFYYDAHAMMAGVLDDLMKNGTLTYQTQPNKPGYLGRNAGSCQFCVNSHWQLPQGCIYGKNLESPPPSGFLEKVAEHVVANGRLVPSVVSAALVAGIQPAPVNASAAPSGSSSETIAPALVKEPS